MISASRTDLDKQTYRFTMERVRKEVAHTTILGDSITDAHRRFSMLREDPAFADTFQWEASDEEDMVYLKQWGPSASQEEEIAL
jgi:hypothetical protein